MRLSADEIAAALSGLSEAECAELLALLEREKQEAETQIDDPRLSLASMLAKADRDYAALTESPEQYIAAVAAHRAARDKHRVDPPDDGDVGSWLARHLDAFRQASKLVAVDAPMPDWEDMARKMPPEAARAPERLTRAEPPQPDTAPPAAPPQPLKGQPYVARSDLDRFTDRSGVRWPDEEFADR
jgi:hypothetical protein